MSISLTGALRTPKVTTGLAPNLQSMRQLYPSEIINQNRDLYDIYGRPSRIDSINSRTSGTDPLYDIENGNRLRPQYSYYLNLPEALDQTPSDNTQMPSRMQSLARDTMGVQRDQAFNMNPAYRIVGPPRMTPRFTAAGPQGQSDLGFLRSIEQQSRIANRVNMQTRYGAATNNL